MSQSEPVQEASPRGPLALVLVILGIFAKLLPHPANFSPVGAASLFSGARLPRWQAYLIPVGILALTDPILNAYYNFPLFSSYSIFTYIGFLISVWLGRRFLRKSGPLKIAAVCILSSVQFFIVSNFGSWLFGIDYPRTAAGLAQSYVMALPFFRTTLLSDLFFTAVLFGLHAWLTRMATARKQPVAA